MKAAPDKIYMTPSFGEPDNVLLASFSKSHLNFHRDVEYIRTNVFIGRAATWIANRYQANGSYLCADDIEDFRDFMKGE